MIVPAVILIIWGLLCIQERLDDTELFAGLGLITLGALIIVVRYYFMA